MRLRRTVQRGRERKIRSLRRESIFTHGRNGRPCRDLGGSFKWKKIHHGSESGAQEGGSGGLGGWGGGGGGGGVRRAVIERGPVGERTFPDFDSGKKGAGWRVCRKRLSRVSPRVLKCPF